MYRQEQKFASVKVDTQTSRNALRIANEAKQIGVSTLVELTIQAGISFIQLAFPITKIESFIQITD